MLNGKAAVLVGRAAGNDLYRLGLPKVSSTGRDLVYGDGVKPFLWMGETTWNAPINYPTTVTDWRAQERGRTVAVAGVAAKRFTTVLVAPAAQTQVAEPSGGWKGFALARTDCSAAERQTVPHRCSRWETAYWRNFDQLVKDANDRGILVVVGGVMDPLVRGGDNQPITPKQKFPRVAESKVFARNLAARLAGSYVAFSPSYDALPNDTTADNPQKTVVDLINAVGPEIRRATARHLIGVHLGGSTRLEDYLQFQSMPWLDVDIFQSGHASSNRGGIFCQTLVGAPGEVCRAREGSLEFRCIRAGTSVATTTTGGTQRTAAGGLATGICPESTLPRKPVVNIEGSYDEGTEAGRQSERHTGWTSALSGSFGYNIGLWPEVVLWTNSQAWKDDYQSNKFKADNDLTRMNTLLNQLTWANLEPRHNLLIENGTGALVDQTKWRHLAVDATLRSVLVHVPRVVNNSLPVVKVATNATNSISGLNCGSWTMQWVSPRFEQSLTRGATCTSSVGQLQFAVAPPPTGVALPCSLSEGCDWVLQLTKNAKSGGASGNGVVAFLTNLRTWTELTADGTGSLVMAEVTDNQGVAVGASFVVSASTSARRKSVASVRDNSGSFLVLWEEEQETGVHDVRALLLGSDGEVLVEEFRLSDPSEDHQAEPWVSANRFGPTAVSWTRFALDGSLGDIYLKQFDESGASLGSELRVNEETLGNQHASQVAVDLFGNAMVAWTNDPAPDPPLIYERATPTPEQGVYFRIFRFGSRLGHPSRRATSAIPGKHRLVSLEAREQGGFEVRWEVEPADGSPRRLLKQDLDENGESLVVRESGS